MEINQKGSLNSFEDNGGFQNFSQSNYNSLGCVNSIRFSKKSTKQQINLNSQLSFGTELRGKGTQLCRPYHLNQCLLGQNCNQRHLFLFNEDHHALQRINMVHNITELDCKLTKIRNEQKDYFVLRSGNMISFFDSTAVPHQQVFKFSLPSLPSGQRYNYYSHKGSNIFYSFKNQSTGFEDMGFVNIPTQKTIHVSSSHTGIITGMQFFNENILLTTSKTGDLKVWILEGQNLFFHEDYTTKLRQCFNPEGLKLELLFLDISEINGIKCVAMGTNDGRLLFFTGNQMTFSQVSFKDEAYSRVGKIRYTTKSGNFPSPCVVVLLWGTQTDLNCLSQVTLMEYNLTTSEQIILAQSSGQDPLQSICTFELIDQYLMIGTLNGELSIYLYSNPRQRIGVIYHQNVVTDIILCQEAKENEVITKKMVVLERKADKRNGSLGFYVIR